MRRLPKTLKFLHTLAACGIIGGIGCHMILLIFAPQETPAAYADMRQSISAISNYVLVPSLAIVLISGLLSMAVHTPFLNRGWAWLKAGMGFFMFKAVLTIVGVTANQAADIAQRIEEGEPAEALLQAAIFNEWAFLIFVMILSVANVVLGVWRPRFSRRPRATTQRAPELVAGTDVMPANDQRARPAA